MVLASKEQEAVRLNHLGKERRKGDFFTGRSNLQRRKALPCLLTRMVAAVPAMAFLLAVLASLSCTQDIAQMAGGGFLAATSEPKVTVVTGRVVAQGRSAYQDVSITATRSASTVVAETVVEGLEVPWALGFAPDGRILVTERAGRIRVVRDGVLEEAPLADLPVATVSESGLMGIALHPSFKANGFLYVCYTYRNAAGRLFNRVARLTDAGGVAKDLRVILDSIPAARNHNGCRLRFGPDGKLYVTMGDAQDSDLAQDLNSLSGKVLRLEADGSVPEDNPIPGSYVYTYGHRNPQGLDWHPGTGDLFITEHGPNTDDEINILVPGGNYGWPRVLGVARDARYVDPILTFTPTVALAGAAFFTGDRLPEDWEGNFLFANLKAAHLHRVVLAPPEFRTVLSQERLFQGKFGRLRAVARSPDGYIYFTTSNRDGRGRPRPGDDRLLRLVRAPANPTAVIYPGPEGNFKLELAPGDYRLRWSLPGFLSFEQQVAVSGTDGVSIGTITLLAGDTDGDGDVDADDVAVVREAFGQPAPPGSPADLNADGVVDVIDLALLGSNWGETGR